MWVMIQTIGSGRWSSDAGEGLTVRLLRREGRNYKSELDEQLGIHSMALPLELCRILKEQIYSCSNASVCVRVRQLVFVLVNFCMFSFGG